jgi:hypothetical protein
VADFSRVAVEVAVSLFVAVALGNYLLLYFDFELLFLLIGTYCYLEVLCNFD